MTDEELTNYIHSSIIMSLERGLSLDFDKIVLKSLAAYGTIDNELSNGLKAKLEQKGLEEIYKVQLLQSGYIAVTNDTIPLKYGLTRRGEKVQQAGGLIEFLRKEKSKRRLDLFKNLSLYIITPLTAFISTCGLIYSIGRTDKPIEIKQPINLHIDNLKQNHNEDTCITASSNRDTIKIKPKKSYGKETSN